MCILRLQFPGLRVHCIDRLLTRFQCDHHRCFACAAHLGDERFQPLLQLRLICCGIQRFARSSRCLPGREKLRKQDQHHGQKADPHRKQGAPLFTLQFFRQGETSVFHVPVSSSVCRLGSTPSRC